jgi:hypothetical protein
MRLCKCLCPQFVPVGTAPGSSWIGAMQDEIERSFWCRHDIPFDVLAERKLSSMILAAHRLRVADGCPSQSIRCSKASRDEMN